MRRMTDRIFYYILFLSKRCRWPETETEENVGSSSKELDMRNGRKRFESKPK